MAEDSGMEGTSLDLRKSPVIRRENAMTVLGIVSKPCTNDSG
jgi:hypothetical protein